MRKMFALTAATGLFACTAAAADDRMRGYGVGEEIPVTLTLHTSNGEPRGRQTPIYSKYRPTVRFAGGPGIVCSVTIPAEVRSIAPGQTAEASLGCQEAVTVRQAATGFVMIEGSREVGVGQVRLPPAP
ncbi:hypothetical protein QFW77_02300 [Luteimonas sp. RD2P54]|uniref:Translation elongation factor EFTu/EF1A C-terminal domain-containing protein n=1 Tax=Luteimonas endophytica TaxID=3042023 RepID=A0ABT6J5L6_9GAMM|nr:hypothetical protein [Luteimonas endophytica]MDH5821827.1 hypothetical protein [Luteimonas endophytica]